MISHTVQELSPTKNNPPYYTVTVQVVTINQLSVSIYLT